MKKIIYSLMLFFAISGAVSAQKSAFYKVPIESPQSNPQYYYIINSGNNVVVDAGSGTQLPIASQPITSNSDTQLWRFVKNADGTYHIFNKGRTTGVLTANFQWDNGSSTPVSFRIAGEEGVATTGLAYTISSSSSSYMGYTSYTMTVEAAPAGTVKWVFVKAPRRDATNCWYQFLSARTAKTTILGVDKTTFKIKWHEGNSFTNSANAHWSDQFFRVNDEGGTEFSLTTELKPSEKMYLSGAVHSASNLTSANPATYTPYKFIAVPNNNGRIALVRKNGANWEQFDFNSDATCGIYSRTSISAVNPYFSFMTEIESLLQAAYNELDKIGPEFGKYWPEDMTTVNTFRQDIETAVSKIATAEDNRDYRNTLKTKIENFQAYLATQTVNSIGESLTLNGTNQYMYIPHNDIFNFTADQEFSVSMQVNVAALKTNARFLAKRGGGSDSDKSGYDMWGTNSLTNFYAMNCSKSDGTNHFSQWGSGVGKLNEWIHLAFTVSGTGSARKVRMYQNGVQVYESANVSTYAVSNTRDVYIGSIPTEIVVNRGLLQGMVDNIRFWNKALTVEELELDSRSNVNSSTPNLLAAYDFENVDYENGVVPDIKGANPGVLVNYSALSVTNLIQRDMAGRGNANDAIIRATLTTTREEGAVLNSATLNFAGTTDINNISKVKLYLTNTTTDFDHRNPTGKGAILLGECTPAEGDVVCNISGAGATLAGNSSYYLWVAAEIAETATEGNQIDISIKKVNYNNTKEFIPEVTNPSGTTNILLAYKVIAAQKDAGDINFYRIPAIVTANDGSLIALTDKRKGSHLDLPRDIDVLAYRSTDNGKTWSDPATIALGTGYGNGFGDVAACVTKSGKILTLFAGGPGFFESTSSNPIRVYQSESTDNGQTWTAPVNRTSHFYGSGYTGTDGRDSWKGIFMTSGKMEVTATGRIMVVALVRNSIGTCNYVFYSDDEGATWDMCPSVVTTGANEAKIVQKANGDLMVSTRKGGSQGRIRSISTDGGQTWTNGYFSELVEPDCNGDMIRYTCVNDGYDANRLLHTIPNAGSRRNVTVFLSTDEGNTWPIKKVLCKDGSAYSALTILSDGTIGAFVEVDNSFGYHDMIFMNFSLDWLTGSQNNLKYPVKTWKGGTSNDSETAANWLYGLKPAVNDDVLVDVKTPNNLTLNSNATYNKLINNSEMTIAAGKQLTVNGAANNNGTIKLLSDATNGTATLVGDVTGTAVVEQLVNKPQTYYIGSPVSGTVNGIGKVITFTESTDKWSVPATITNLEVGKGYGVQVGAGEIGGTATISFTGTLNSGNKTIGMTIGGRKFNFLGNPYPSFLNSVEVVKSVNVEKSLWFYSKASGSYGFTAYNVPTGIAIPDVGDTDGFIPPMQGFWIKAKAETDFNFTNEMRIHKPESSSAAFRVPQAAERQLMRLQVTNGTEKDETVILFSEEATSDWNSFKPMNPGLTLYTVKDGEKLALNSRTAIEYDVETAVGIKATSGEYTFSAIKYENFGTEKAFLLDKLTNVSTDLSSGGDYIVTFSEAYDGADRFALVFPRSGVMTGLEGAEQAGFFAFANNNRITVSSDMQAGMIYVFNSVGQQVAAQAISGKLTIVSAALPAGVYIVKLNNQTTKVVVK
ncbi:MAG TPA: T9SS type A sorting domain-containing protein [Bacteroidales bacterium]|nr:T9SS type A sorting domain-containing protein [Bacteroidales bacterium]